MQRKDIFSIADRRVAETLTETYGKHDFVSTKARQSAILLLLREDEPVLKRLVKTFTGWQPAFMAVVEEQMVDNQIFATVMDGSNRITVVIDVNKNEYMLL